MGGSSTRKPLGKIGDKTIGKSALLKTVVAAPTAMYNPKGFLETAKGGLQDITRNVGEALGELTGANALRKQMMDQQAAAEEEARRQANISDAMARNAGGDPTNIFLSTGNRRKRGSSGGGVSTGSVGTGSSKNTGVQN